MKQRCYLRQIFTKYVYYDDIKNEKKLGVVVGTLAAFNRQQRELQLDIATGTGLDRVQHDVQG